MLRPSSIIYTNSNGNVHRVTLGAGVWLLTALWHTWLPEQSYCKENARKAKTAMGWIRTPNP